MNYDSDKLYTVVRRIRAEREQTVDFSFADFEKECMMIYCMQAPSHYTMRKRLFTGQTRKPRVNTNPMRYGLRTGNGVFNVGITDEDAMRI